MHHQPPLLVGFRLDGFIVNSFSLDSAGTQFTLYNSASATSTDFSVFEHNVGQDLNSDGVIGHAFSTANGVVSASTYSPSYQLNNKSAGSSFLFGSAFSSNHTIFQTSGEIVSFNGNFYQYDFLVLGTMVQVFLGILIFQPKIKK